MRKTLIASALTILVIIAIAGMAVAQSQTKFVDNSPTGSPIRLAETVNANGECGITALNTDKRPVVAVVVDFDAGPVAGHMTHDHFLRRDEHVAMYGYEFPIEDFPCSTATVTATTKFVQFNDGQVWEGSDAKTVSEVATNRRDSIDYLGEVLAASDVASKLAQKTTKLTREAERQLLKMSDDPIQTAKDRLANADAHSSWLNSLVN